MTDELTDRLYNLLPAHYRRRDFDQGQVLRALLAIAEEPLRALERDVEQLYDNWFIETCAEWVVPYIGDLLGVRVLHASSGEGLTLRAFVANTLAFRRRKGTAGMLERVAQDVSGWPAASVEYFQLLSTTANVNHVRLDAPGTASLRDRVALSRLGGPFERAPHTIDVRSIRAGRGRHGISNLGVFVWTLRSVSAQGVTAAEVPVAETGGQTGFFRVSPLGQDLELWNPRTTSERLDVRQTPDQVPEPLAFLPLYQCYAALRAGSAPPAEHDALRRIFDVAIDGTAVPPEQITICDLSSWHRPPVTSPPAPPIRLALDPVLGRIALPVAGSHELLVSSYYGAPGEVGGGMYVRPPEDEIELTDTPVPVVVVAGGGPALAAALATWLASANVRAVLEIADSRTYDLPDTSSVPAGRHLQIRAARSGPQRPLLLAVAASPGHAWNIALGAAAHLTLEGLWIAAGVRVAGQDTSVLTLADCTLVPGCALDNSLDASGRTKGLPLLPGESSLAISDNDVAVTVRRSILGPLRASAAAGSVLIEDSILDPALPDASEPVTPALRAGQLTIRRSTVLGSATARELVLAEDTLFMFPLTVARIQAGCARFCYLASGSITPRPFRCQPQLALAALPAQPPSAQLEAARGSERVRVRPAFLCRRFGRPDYARLAPATATEISEGASDDGEMGAFQRLQLPKRNANLRAALDEYSRFGLEVGTFPAVLPRRTS